MTTKVLEWSSKNKVGFVLGIIAAALNLIPIPSDADGEGGHTDGPPVAVLVVGAVVALAWIVGFVIGWAKRNRVWIRVATGCAVVTMLGALPAFFADVPGWVKLMVTVYFILTVASFVLVYSKPAAVTQTSETITA